MSILGKTVLLGYGDVGVMMFVNPNEEMGQVSFSRLDNPVTEAGTGQISDEDLIPEDSVKIIFDYDSAKLMRDAFAKACLTFERIEQERLQTEK